MASPGFQDELRFLRGALARPRSVGAIAPSSPALARAIAAQIDPILPGKVLELGPGTGVVTQAIVAMGVQPERLVMIEYDPHFANLLADRFIRARVIQGDAYDLERTLGTMAEPFAAVVSGLPLLNQPELILTAGVQHTVHIGSGGEIVFDLNARYEDERLLGYAPFQAVESNVVSNFSVAYGAPGDAWRVQAYVNNISDEAVPTGINSAFNSAHVYSASLRAPRTYGLRLSSSF